MIKGGCKTLGSKTRKTLIKLGSKSKLWNNELALMWDHSPAKSWGSRPQENTPPNSRNQTSSLSPKVRSRGVLDPKFLGPNPNVNSPSLDSKTFWYGLCVCKGLKNKNEKFSVIHKALRQYSSLVTIGEFGQVYLQVSVLHGTHQCLQILPPSWQWMRCRLSTLTLVDHIAPSKSPLQTLHSPVVHPQNGRVWPAHHVPGIKTKVDISYLKTYFWMQNGLIFS